MIKKAQERKSKTTTLDNQKIDTQAKRDSLDSRHKLVSDKTDKLGVQVSSLN